MERHSSSTENFESLLPCPDHPDVDALIAKSHALIKRINSFSTKSREALNLEDNKKRRQIEFSEIITRLQKLIWDLSHQETYTSSNTMCNHVNGTQQALGELYSFISCKTVRSDSEPTDELIDILPRIVQIQEHISALQQHTISKADEIQIHIRWMIMRDMPQVLTTEQRSFTHAWKPQAFRHFLKDRTCIGMVGECTKPISAEGQVLGHIVYSLQRRRIQLISMATREDIRGRGIGSQFIQKLLEKINAQRRSCLYAIVHERDIDGLNVLRDNGMEYDHTLHEACEHTDEDLYCMAYRKPGAEEYEELYEPMRHRYQLAHTVEV